jgi:hypothetical protein
MSTINSVNSLPYIPPVATSPTAPSSSSTSSSSPSVANSQVQDLVELSLAGRIAIGVGDGTLTSTQGQQLQSQLQTINQQIQSGGTGVGQVESQLSQSIYGDGHNGASIPTNLTVTTAEAREFIQAGRIVSNEGAGNISSTQASQLFSQLGQIAQQSQTASTSATNQSQNQLSAEIYEAAHSGSNPATGS